MVIKHIQYLASYTDPYAYPAPKRPSFAFIGRSNVGKSSLINYLSGRKAVAKTSRRPGKTQCINFFLVNDQWYLVDLPGYGWARVSQAARQAWYQRLLVYLEKNPCLEHLFLLVDSRIPLQALDLRAMHWISRHQVPYSVVFTKADGSKAVHRKILKKEISTKLEAAGLSVPAFYTTATKQQAFGKEALLEGIQSHYHASVA